jgi:biotin synthase-like enzyme
VICHKLCFVMYVVVAFLASTHFLKKKNASKVIRVGFNIHTHNYETSRNRFK